MVTAENGDLHAHTTASDGVLSPAAVVDAAVAAGLSTLAITDHDTTAGVAPARAAAEGSDLDIVAGIEISTRHGNREVHLLGLFIDPEGDSLAELKRCQRSWRRERAVVMVERAQKKGLRIDLEQVDRIAGDAPIGRPHLAEAVLRSGAVSTMQEAFDRHFGIGRSCFVPKRMVETTAAIAAVHGAGGVAVVAHPASSRVRETRLRDLAAAGLDGVEIRHPRHSAQQIDALGGLCARLGLLPSGGSDFHGPGRGDSRLGDIRIPEDWCQGLQRRAAEYRDGTA